MIFNKKLLSSLFILMALFTFGFGDKAEAQVCPDTSCDWLIGEDCTGCPTDCNCASIGKICGVPGDPANDNWGCVTAPPAFVCGNSICEAGEDSTTCPGDCPPAPLPLPLPPASVGLCGTCVADPDCEAGLTCSDGKCRGCPCAAGEICFCNPLKACAFTELSESIIDFVFYFAIAFAPIMFIIAGFYFITAGGDSTKINTGKTIAKWTIVGLMIVLFAKAIISIINALLGTS
ncbi:MAG: pilin [bacterium]